MSVISIDYDDTYTADPAMWDAFMRTMRDRGHIPVMVTFRDGGDPTHIINGVDVEIFYTNGKPKAEFMRQEGLEVDIWVDDWPELIGSTK